MTLSLLGGVFDYEDLKKSIIQINVKLQDPLVWSDIEQTSKLNISLKHKNNLINSITAIQDTFNDLKDYEQLFDTLNVKDVSDLANNINLLQKDINNLKIQTLLKEETDDANAFIEIHAGAGGTESQDWAEMLERMYLKFCDKNDYKYELIDRQKGEEAGVKSATYLIKGFKTFGYLKNESGIHRLVRISPFDSNSRRHTSFSSVWVYPEVDENIDVDINPKDLRIDTFRASGAGGQHVNTTDSAIRITHTKLNIVVQSQAERSQHRNKETAMKMLRSRVYEFELNKKNEQKTQMESNKKEIGWGHQIRSYVLHPYKMIKDLRTNYQSSNTESVLDGNIFEFLESSLIGVQKN